MLNVLLRFPGTSGKAVAITGHYDTKRVAMTNFVGANDGGSSTGFLIELARAVSKSSHPDDIWIVFFDGEEAVGEWTATDSLYGSRHVAEKWGADGTLAKLRALINIDMIGDKDLDVFDEANSSQSLRDMVRTVAAELGTSAYFRKQPSAVDDDHMPFVDRGVNAIDLIDLNYGPPDHTYWHTGADTKDKLAAHSFQVVGDVVLGVLAKLEHGKG
jgi:Zn-dependent M28 family amino/carboxypeptidase